MAKRTIWLTGLEASFLALMLFCTRNGDKIPWKTIKWGLKNKPLAYELRRILCESIDRATAPMYRLLANRGPAVAGPFLFLTF